MIAQRTSLGWEIAAVGVAGGLMGDALLRVGPPGVNMTLCIAALVAAAVVLVRRHRLAAGPDAPWLAITALLLGAAFLRRDAEALAVFDSFALLLTLCLGAASVQGERIGDWRILDYARAAVTGAAASLIGAIVLVAKDLDWTGLPQSGRLRNLRGIVTGVLIAAPLLLVFTALFAAADQVFANVLENLLAFDVEAVAQHAILIMFWGGLVAGYLRWSLIGRPVALPPVADRMTLGIVPVATALALINALFLLFVVVQLRYFFGGASLVEETTGLTYASYARRGFGELVFASGLVLPTLLGADHLIRGAAPAHVTMFRRLASLLMILLAVVMMSAMQRLRLYVAAYGLSEIRLYASAFMVFLLGVFAWFAWTVLRGAPGARQRFAFGSLMLGFVILAGLHVLNPGAFIVRTNLERPAAEQPFDAKYAVSLGGDAVPVLIEALPRLAIEERCVVAAGLLDRWNPEAATDWRTWNWSRSRARQLVRENADALRAMACKIPEAGTA
jgi:hypothetical protein